MSTWNTIFQQWIDFDKYILEHPDLGSYVYDNKPPPSAEAKYYKTSLYLVDYVLDFIENTLITGNYISDTNITRLPGWEATFALIFSSSPLLCGRLQEYRTFYSGPLTDIADHNCAASSK